MQIKLIRSYFFAIFFLLCCCAKAELIQQGVGHGLQKNKHTISILFVNGINVDPAAAAASSEELVKVINASGIEREKFNYSYHYNATQGFVKDNDELLLQAKISSNAAKGISSRSGLNGNRATYYAALGSYYNSELLKMDSTKRSSDPTKFRVVTGAKALRDRIVAILDYSSGVVIVPHSQGNFFTEAAYSMLVAERRTDLTQKIRVVGVASVAATSPNDTYITSIGDMAIFAQSAQTLASAVANTKDWPGYHSPLPANHTACWLSTMFSARDIFCDPNGVAYSSFDKTGHGFTQVYLNYDLTEKGGRSAFPEIIASMIERSFEQLGLLTRFSGTIKVPADKMYGVNFIIPGGAQKCQFSPSGTWSVFSKNENSIVTSAARTAPTKANGKVINSLTGALVFWQKGTEYSRLNALRSSWLSSLHALRQDVRYRQPPNGIGPEIPGSVERSDPDPR